MPIGPGSRRAWTAGGSARATIVFVDPALRQDDKTFGGVGALDDFQFPGPDPGGGRCLALVGALGKDLLDEGKEAAHPGQDRERAIAVLDTGGLDLADQQHAQGVDGDMPLDALDLLARVVPGRIQISPAALLTLWLAMMAAVGLASFPASSRTNRAKWIRSSVPSQSHSLKYWCTVLRGGKSFGRARHWQPSS